MERVGDMTREELKQLVGELVEEQVTRALRENGVGRKIGNQAGTGKKWSWQKISQEIDRIGWTPPADAPTPLEMLREDRDR